MNTTDPSALRITGPGELLAAIPHFLGFHPIDSLVIIGLASGRLVVTARMDLADAEDDQLLGDTLEAMTRGGVTEITGAVYVGTKHDTEGRPHPAVITQLRQQSDEHGIELLDVFIVVGNRWWSELCDDAVCCPSEGNELPSRPTAFTTASVVAGVVVAPTREAMADRFAPAPNRTDLQALIDEAENATTAAVLEGRAERHDRSVQRAMFAAAQVAKRGVYPSDIDVARFVVALRQISVRDSYWLKIDTRGFDGQALWLNLAQRAPSPYDAAPLFLYAWPTWRSGKGALASMAVERARQADPDYSAANMLHELVCHGVDPRHFPKLRPMTSRTEHTIA
ncbi:DUF4192 domain-containing protein [uncultured Jatrophihabitans sp.]|uniref:DUF4192 domain-containing protein n=1 Tax=uncultured Jatrophihabitans sp. TaxID=1610747 RepID=UPI0035CA64B4